MAQHLLFPRFGRDSDPGGLGAPLWYQIFSRFLFLLAAALLLGSLGTRIYAPNLIVLAFAIVCLAQGSVGVLYARVWLEERKRVRDTKCELQSIFQHVLDGILLLDDKGVCLQANPAAFAILGAPRSLLIGRSFVQFYKQPSQFDVWWRGFLGLGFQHGQTELVRCNRSRVIVNYTLTANYLPGRHAMILCDITERVFAEAQVADHLIAAEAARAVAESAGAEAEALRRATFALTQNLRMDAVLDTLLETLHSIVPNDVSSVLLTEEEDRLFVARERPAAAARPVVTLERSDNKSLEGVVVLRKSIYIPDTRADGTWREHKPFWGLRSWIAVPLIVSDAVLGVLSVGSREPRAFTTDQFHRAKLLAIPAAVAIHNARLYEWAQIYAAERQTLLKKLGEVGEKHSDLPHDRMPN